MADVDKHLVAVLALDGVIPFELGIPARIFGMARDEAGQRLYEVVTCALRPGLVTTNHDFELLVKNGPEVLGRSATVVIPASYELDLAYRYGQLPDDLATALASLRPGTRIASICTASFILAAAGLLDGRPATTHWMHTAQLARMFPLVKVEPDVLFIDDGDVLTSAGVASGVDLCLHMVRRDHGAEVANRVARRSLVPPWRDGGQAQYIEHPMPPQPAASTATAREWALRRLAEPVTLPQLAARARMSVRTFTRRFREEVGMTCGQWLIAQRVELARRLLESSDLPADEVARRAGFGTSASLRRHLHSVIGVSPMSYRRTFNSRR
jgi:transcriptional regulator GlxA family with amidase domain